MLKLTKGLLRSARCTALAFSQRIPLFVDIRSPGAILPNSFCLCVMSIFSEILDKNARHLAMSLPIEPRVLIDKKRGLKLGPFRISAF